jgi:lysozyme
VPVSLPALGFLGFCDGLDLSAVQRIDDADAIYAAGFRFAFVKASEGLRGRDPAYQRLAGALQRAGLHVGAYGFAHVSQGQPRSQARHLYDTATADGRHVVRCVMDLEDCPPGTPWQVLRDFAAEYLDELRSTGGLPVFYLPESWLPHFGGMGVPMWVAQYRSVTAPWAPTAEQVAAKLVGDVELWQYSGNAGYRVDGIPVDVDRNAFRGDEATLRAWFGLAPE